MASMVLDILNIFLLLTAAEVRNRGENMHIREFGEKNYIISATSSS